MRARKHPWLGEMDKTGRETERRHIVNHSKAEKN